MLARIDATRSSITEVDAAIETAMRRGSTRCRKGNTHLNSAMFDAARVAARAKDSYASAQYHRLAHRGLNKATIAVAHSLLVAVWHVLHDQIDYSDLGGDYFKRRQDPVRMTRQLVHRLEELGHRVELTPAA